MDNKRGVITESEAEVTSVGNSQNRTRDNRVVPNWEKRTERLYIVTLLI